MQINIKDISYIVDPKTGVNKEWKFWDHVQNGSLEPDTFHVFERYLSKEHSYLDIGSWIGPTVLFGAQLSKHVYGFEPDPKAFQQLKTNIGLNPNITNISTFPVAIATTTGTMSFGSNTEMGDSMSSALFEKNKITVDCITLQEVLSTNNITDVNFIKIDIEGGEFHTLPSLKTYLKNDSPTLYLSLHAPWFKDKKTYFDTIFDCISHYKYFYHQGKSISLKDMRTKPGFTEVLATNTKW